MTYIKDDKDGVAEEIDEWIDDAREKALEMGLDPYDVMWWIVDNEEMNELATYGGFQSRYPHWRWGMKYDRQQKQSQYGGGKIFELVNNDDPAHAFLQRSNDMADQKGVVTHVYGHADFFKNNRWFEDSTNASQQLEQNAERIQEIMDLPDVDRDDVESLIDTALCIEDTIDQHRLDDVRVGDDGESTTIEEYVEAMDVDESIKDQFFDDEWVERVEDDEDRSFYTDVLEFVALNGQRYDRDEERAVEFEDWEKEVLQIMHDEAMYFAPQKMTKVLNEGWACVAPDTRVVTPDGMVEMSDVVDSEIEKVSDGVQSKRVRDYNVIEDHDTVMIETKGGFTITGSDNHRVRSCDGSWVRLDEVDVGDGVEIVGGNDMWSEEYVPVEWWSRSPSVTAHDVAEEAGCSYGTVFEYVRDGYVSEAMEKSVRSAIDDVGWEPGAGVDGNVLDGRTEVRVPDSVTESVGKFLGHMIAEGNITPDDASSPNRVQFTNGNEEMVNEMEHLFEECFGIEPTVRRDGSRWRVTSEVANLKDLLVSEFDLKRGKSARRKVIPDHIFESPRTVVVSFLEALFSGDAYTGDQGIIYCTFSEDLAIQVQELLANFGMWSNRSEQSDGGWHVHLTGKSADMFLDEIGFVQDEKEEKARQYVEDLEWFENEVWEDDIVSVEEGVGDVYDITVEDTHRYEAAGFVNHNSHVESRMMTDEQFADENEFLTYADSMSRVLESPGFNPYKLGLEIWQYVENEANKREVVDKLLRVDGITPRTLHEQVDFDHVEEILDNPDSYSPVMRNFSLVRPENRGVLRNVSVPELEEQYRYLMEDDRYETVAEALSDVDYSAGWDRMLEVRETHVDVTFIDEFVTEEFIERNDYFTYDYDNDMEMNRVSSTDPGDVKKKLLLQFTNFGKPTIVVEDDNYNNAGELLLTHKYNGISLDTKQARKVLRRLFDVWGRPVHLRTIVKYEGDERGYELSYDGTSDDDRELQADEYEYLLPDVDYDTTPEEW